MTAILKLLGWQGLVGLAAVAILSALLAFSHGQTRHWKAEAAKEHQAFVLEKQAFDQTVLNYRTAAAKAADSDRQNKIRVEAETHNINERSQNDYETRIAAARAELTRLQQKAATANSSGANKPAVSGVSHPASGTDAATPKAGLSDPDALIATEQGIQLDELIKWVKAVGKVNTNGANNGMVTTNSTGR